MSHVRPQERVQTNILMLEMVDRGAEEYCRLLEKQGIIAGPVGDDRVRLVFYKEIGDVQAQETVRLIRELDRELG